MVTRAPSVWRALMAWCWSPPTLRRRRRTSLTASGPRPRRGSITGPTSRGGQGSDNHWIQLCTRHFVFSLSDLPRIPSSVKVHSRQLLRSRAMASETLRVIGAGSGAEETEERPTLIEIDWEKQKNWKQQVIVFQSSILDNNLDEV